MVVLAAQGSKSKSKRDFMRDSDDMSMDVNHWRINNPKYQTEEYQKSRYILSWDSYWTGICGTNYFLQMGNPNKGVSYSWYCKEEHFYLIYWQSTREIIFGSYDINEIIRFANKLITTKGWLHNLYVRDAVTKTYYGFVTDEFPDNVYRSYFTKCEDIHLGSKVLQ